MGDKLEVRTLGGLSVQKGGRALEGLASRKAEALLVYLGMRPQAHSREALATLLWSELPPARALANLSVLLTSLRKEIAPFLTIGPDSISRAAESEWDIDALRLESLIGHGPSDPSDPAMSPAEEALQLYRGEFLEGFYLRGATSFEEWAAVQRERLRHLVLQALGALVDSCVQTRQYARGLRHAHTLIELDPLAESAHRQAMLLCARLGDPTRALAVYESCRKSLRAELGIEPSIETRTLYHRILAMRETAASNLPIPLTPFVGREGERARLTQRLTDPETRWVTVLGPGGVGKTRLAIEVADEVRSMFLDGVCFVSLAGLGPATQVDSALAGALNLDLYGATSPRNQLQDYLREKELLVVWDGIEHLVKDLSLITEILNRAPRVKFLVTSRQRINLPGEWVFPVEGMQIPALEDTSPETYGAIRLFINAVERAGGTFEMSPETAPCAVEICRLVDGSPMGIELAAAWIRVLPCQEVAAEIRRNLDFLSSSAEGEPLGQRSLRAVFERSWELLGEDERDMLGSLSGFVGGFGREAAEQVAGATVALLTSLIDKSLLTKSGDDRYGVHDLVRQFAAEKLRADPVRQAGVEARHSAYYAARFGRSYAALSGRSQKSELAALVKEIENLRAAWNRSIDERWENLVGESLDGLWLFYERAGWNQEAEEVLGRAVAAWRAQETATAGAGTDESRQLLGRLLSRHGWFCVRLSLHDRAQEAYAASRVILSTASDQREMSFATRGLSAVAYRRGAFSESVALGEESLAFAEACGDDRETARSLNTLGLASIALGQLVQGREKLYESLEYFRKSGDQAAMSAPLHNLGISALWRGDYVEAGRYLEEGLAIREEYGGPLAVTESMNPVADLAIATGDYAKAVELHENCLAVSRQHGQRTYQVWSLLGLATIAGALGRTAEEERWVSEALEIVNEQGDRWGKANCLALQAELASARGERERARGLARETLAIRREIGSPWGEVLSLNLLGTIVAEEGNAEEGWGFFQEALPRALALGGHALAVDSLAGLGRTHSDPVRGRELLDYSRRNPAASAATRSKADRWFAELESARGKGRRRKVRDAAKAKTRSIEEIAEEVLKQNFGSRR